jgi:hypothetical protein
MEANMIRSACLILVAATSGFPALAQVTSIESATAARQPKLAGDLNRIVCDRVQRTGSRLAVDKVCMTVREWADHRDGHRADLEKVQQVVNQEPSH